MMDIGVHWHVAVLTLIVERVMMNCSLGFNVGFDPWLRTWFGPLLDPGLVMLYVLIFSL